MPANGGDPKRLTYHPGIDRVKRLDTGWAVCDLFVSKDDAPQEAFTRLWKVSVDGGGEEPLTLPRAWSGSFSPDGSKLAYEEIPQPLIPGWYEASYWRHL